MTDQEYLYLKKKMLTMTGIDLDSYKSQQMRRRLSAFIENNNETDVIHYCKIIEQDESRLKKLCDFITINVTEFCRDAAVFQELEKNILPAILEKKDYINIWSAGCSNGAEVYSIAMLLCESRKKVNYRILGTDMDEISLARASGGGPYKDDLLKNVPKQLVAKYFTQDNGDYWVKKEIKEKAVFRRHNLLADKFETGFDLIVCRNVTIYFTEEAKEKLNQRFYESLRENGVLFVGATEFMINAQKIGFGKFGSCFYQKRNSASLAKV